MKLPWKRQPRDLVGEQVQEVYKRPLTPEEEERLKWAGMVLAPGDVNFPVTAANGWCAPSEVLYDMANVLLNANGKPAAVIPMMIDVPEVHVRRGGWPPPTEVYDRATLRRMPAPTPWPAPEPIFKDATAP